MNVLAVGVGGLIGSLLRYGVGEWMHMKQGFPLATLLMNLLGCFFLAWFFTKTTWKWKIHSNLKLAIGTGFTGSFTTFSTFSVETLNLIAKDQILPAVLYVMLSVLGGIGLAMTGAKLALLNIKSMTPREGGSK